MVSAGRPCTTCTWRQPLILCAPVLTEACFLRRDPAQRARLRRVLDDLSIHAYEADDERRLWIEALAWMHDCEDHVMREAPYVRIGGLEGGA